MQQELALSITCIVVGGVGAQWLARRARIPSIVLLLLVGVLAGPVLGVVEPQEQFGALLFPLVSLGVALLLFEGALGLRLAELEVGRSTVVRLVTVGVLVTWLLTALVAAPLFDVTDGQALLLGAVLVVSGPTVVLPLLAAIRTRPRVARVLRWEAILIDPVGAVLAVIVLEVLLQEREGVLESISGVALAVAAGLGAGVAVAAVLLFVLHRHWVPDDLQVAVSLTAVVGAAALADAVQSEAGLLAATTLGLVLANQRRVPVGHIAGFGESIGPLLLAGLFITLGALVDLDELAEVVLPTSVLLAMLVVIARPAAVLVGTARSDLTWPERGYLASVAPRGIVAAAVAALFSLDLEDHGTPFPQLVPVVFCVIVGTVVVYAVLARVAAGVLRVGEPEPTGIALLGAPSWGVDLADALARADVPVLLIGAGDEEVHEAVERTVLVYQGRLDSDELAEAMRAVGVRQAVTLSRREDLNSYGIDRFAALLGRANVFRLGATAADSTEEAGTTRSAVGRRPFGEGVTADAIESSLAGGARFEVLGAAGDLDGSCPLFVVDDKGRAAVVTAPDGDETRTARAIVALAAPATSARRRARPGGS